MDYKNKKTKGAFDPISFGVKDKNPDINTFFHVLPSHRLARGKAPLLWIDFKELIFCRKNLLLLQKPIQLSIHALTFSSSVLIAPFFVYHVQHGVSSLFERICYKSSMTAEEEQFRAHNRYPFRCREFFNASFLEGKRELDTVKYVISKSS